MYVGGSKDFSEPDFTEPDFSEPDCELYIWKQSSNQVSLMTIKMFHEPVVPRNDLAPSDLHPIFVPLENPRSLCDFFERRVIALVPTDIHTI